MTSLRKRLETLSADKFISILLFLFVIMGTQGEIFNVLGIVVPAEEIERGLLYRVNGKLVSTSEDIDRKSVDFFDGFCGAKQPYNFNNPELRIKVLGVDEYEQRRVYGGCFKGEALVGYGIANESYQANATVVPDFSVLESLKPKLVDDIKSKLGVEVTQSRLEVYLLFEFTQ